MFSTQLLLLVDLVQHIDFTYKPWDGFRSEGVLLLRLLEGLWFAIEEASIGFQILVYFVFFFFLLQEHFSFVFLQLLQFLHI